MFIANFSGDHPGYYIFEAYKCLLESICIFISMEKRVLPFAPEAYKYAVKQDRAHWTHYASSQTTKVTDQSMINLVDSNIQ